MIDMTVISAALSTINTAVDIAKYINNANASISEVEFKLNIANLMESLATSKTQIAEIKCLMLDKEDKIQQLEKEIAYLHSDDKPEFLKGVYKFNGDEGMYCTRCWDDVRRKFRVSLSRVPGVGSQAQCVQCKTTVSTL